MWVFPSFVYTEALAVAQNSLEGHPHYFFDLHE